MCAAAVFEIAALKASAYGNGKARRRLPSLAWRFSVDMFFVTTGRTALVIIPALVVVYGIWQSGWKGFVGASVAAAVAGVDRVVRPRPSCASG